MKIISHSLCKTILLRTSILLVFLQSFLLWATAAFASDNLRQSVESWASGYTAQAQGEPLLNTELLSRFYDSRQYAPVWFSNDGLPSAKAYTLIKIIEGIGKEGLLPTDYHGKALDKLSQSTYPATVLKNQWESFDLLLSDAFLSLAKHLVAGKVDPDTIADWKANRRQSDMLSQLQVVANGEKQGQVVADVLDSLRPKQVRYQRLIEAFAAVSALSNDAWSQALADTPSIKPSAEDSRLALITQRLLVWGDITETPIDTSRYTAVLEQGIKQFQGRHGLDADGVVGKETIQALNISPAQRAQQLEVNLERWRWLAEDLGEKHVLVNIAAFEMKIIDKGETVFRKPVVVGRNYRKTPVFSDNIRYIVFNPTWTVPYRLAVEDKLPEIKKDAAYFNRLGIKVFRGDSSSPIDSKSIDWQSLNKRNFPYRLVQSPGAQNALGQVKFMFPNAYDVYLHDTPSRELFKKSQRAFSSGCVRVNDPLVLAAFLLKDKGWDENKIAQVVAGGVTQTVHLKSPMPIHIEYWTAWVDGGNTLNFRNDVYERDLPLWLALHKPMLSSPSN